MLALSCILAAPVLFAEETCSSSPVACNPDTCSNTYCVGPENNQANAPARPRTCDGDVQLSAGLLYWMASQDGMEYGIQNNTTLSPQDDVSAFTGSIVDADYLSPSFKYNYGYRIGLSYFSPCDGWEVGARWTSFNGIGSSKNEVTLGKTTADISGGTLSDVPNAPDAEHIEILWSAFSGVFGQKYLFCGTVNTDWKAPISLLDFELAREFWVSKRVTFRPMVGVRYAQINQKYSLNFQGGVWNSSNLVFSIGPTTLTDQPAYQGELTLRNYFKGVGPQSGIALDWNFGCGWSLYSNVAASILYGRFDVRNDEDFREAVSPFSSSDAAEITENFKASRAIVDLGLGVQYSNLLCEGKYGFTALLAWESHLFFHQNQMWRIKRIGGSVAVAPPTVFPDNFGENTHSQRRGTLSTQGLTLTFKFDF